MKTASDIFKAKGKNGDRELLSKKQSDLTHEVAVFNHYRDVKVAVEDLQEAGFPLSEITLIARRWRSDWLRNLTIYNSLDETSFSLDEAAQNFFQKLFQRGKYLLLLTGRENEMNAAGVIMGRRQAHVKVWQF